MTTFAPLATHSIKGDASEYSEVVEVPAAA